MIQDYYQILGVSPSANLQEIKKAFRKLAFQYHPDHSNQSNKEHFTWINEAYQVLKDEEKRYKYDELYHYYIESGHYDALTEEDRVSYEYEYDQWHEHTPPAFYVFLYLNRHYVFKLQYLIIGILGLFWVDLWLPTSFVEDDIVTSYTYWRIDKSGEMDKVVEDYTRMRTERGKEIYVVVPSKYVENYGSHILIAQTPIFKSYAYITWPNLKGDMKFKTHPSRLYAIIFIHIIMIVNFMLMKFNKYSMNILLTTSIILIFFIFVFFGMVTVT